MNIFSRVFCCSLLCGSLGAQEELASQHEDYSQVQYTESEMDCCSPRTRYPVEFRVGYYYFFDQTMRDVYGNGALDLQLAFTFPFANKNNQQLALFISGEYVGTSGRSLAFYQKTSIQLVPLSVALKYTLNINSTFDWYADLGPRWIFLWQKNDSDFVDGHVKGNNIGVFGGTGLLVQLPKSFFLDFYLEGSYCHIKPSDHKANVVSEHTQVGGLATGFGLGCNF